MGFIKSTDHRPTNNRLNNHIQKTWQKKDFRFREHSHS